MKRGKPRVRLALWLCLLCFCLWPLATGRGQPPPAEKEKEEAGLQQKREDWFYQQRAYPLKLIPSGARLKALEQFERMVEEERAKQQTAAPGLTVAPPPPNATTWTALGPQPTSNPFFTPFTSGRVAALAVCPTNANTVYLGGAQGGIWKTTNGGGTWTAQTDSQPSLAIGSIAIAPSDATCNTVYVGTGEAHNSGDSYYGAGVLKSTDGTTWTQVAGPTQFTPAPFCSSGFCGGPRIAALAVHPTDPNTVLAAVEVFSNTGGIYRSTDGGATWTNVLSGAMGTSVWFDPSNPNIAWAALGRASGDLQNGVYKSGNGGVTWTLSTGTGVNTLPSGTATGRIELALAPSAPNTVYASLANAATGSNDLLGLFKTPDGGTNWIPLTATPNFCTPQCWYDHTIRVLPTNANVVYAGGSAVDPGVLIRSTDGGSTWSDIHIGADGAELHVDTHAIAFAGDGSKVYVGNDGGVWSTTNVATSPVTWTNLNAPLSLTQFYPGHSIHPTNTNITFGGTQDNGTQKFAGDLTWAYATCGDGGWTAIDFTTPTTVYAACQLIEIRKSTSSGTFPSFFRVDGGIAPGDRVQFIPPFVMDSSNSQRLYFGTFRVWRTTNGASGLNPWTAISSDLTTGTGKITTIAVAPSDANTVYIGTSDSKVQVTSNALATPASVAWADRSLGLPPRFITMLAVDPANPMTAYVTFSGFSGFVDALGHVFKTTNAGGSWTDISGNLPNIPVNDIVVDADIPNTLYVATDVGVLRTTNGGATWSPLGTGLPTVAVLGLKLHQASRTLRAATHGRGMWDLSVPVPTNPVPTIASLSPPNTTAGGPGFTLTVIGTNFIDTSVVRWNGSNRATTFSSATQLTASISASDIADGGTAAVTVFNPAPGGGLSNSVTFTINNPAPVLGSISPSSTSAGGPGFVLGVTGSSFVPSSVVLWNGGSRATTFISSTQLQAAILASDIASPGTAPVSVFNPAPAGGTSGSLTFTITTPPNPSLSSLFPSFGFAGGAAFTLVVNGRNFGVASVVRWNGANRTTTFVNINQLTAAIPTTDLAAPGSASVTVFNPAAVGPSNALTFTIFPPNPLPTIVSLSPSTAPAGSGRFSFLVNGSNFVLSSTVRWNGVDRPTTFISSSQLRAFVSASDLQPSASSAQVTVFNPAPGGGTSNIATFTITSPPPGAVAAPLRRKGRRR